MGRQFLAVLCIIAGHMGNHGQTAGPFFHHRLQGLFPVLHGLVDALPRGTAHIHALYALLHKIPGQPSCRVPADRPIPIVTRVKCRDDPSVFIKLHLCYLPVFP